MRLGPRAVATLASDGLTLGGGSGTRPAVTSDSHRVGVEGVNPRGTVRQLHCHLSGLIVGTHSMMGFNVGGLQNGFLSPWEENRKKTLECSIRFLLSVPIITHWLFTYILTPPTTIKLPREGSCFACYHVLSFHGSPRAQDALGKYLANE